MKDAARRWMRCLVRLVRRQLWRAVLCRPEEVAELACDPCPKRLKRFEEVYGATLCPTCKGRAYSHLFPKHRCPWCDDGTKSLPNNSQIELDDSDVLYVQHLESKLK